MKDLRRLLVVVPAAVLVACLVGVFLTRGSMAHLSFLKGRGPATAEAGLVDQRPWQTVQALAPLAVSVEEKTLAREAQRLADHEVDQAFAQALRQASLETREVKGKAKELEKRVAYLQGVVKEDQAKVDSLTASAKAAGPAANTDDLDVAKAQLQLDSDELSDATDDLARESGDKRGQIQQELTAREAAMKKYDEEMEAGGQTAVVSAKRYGTLWGRVSAWFDQRTRMDLLEQAKAQADSDVAALTAQHEETEKKLTAAGQTAGANSDRPGDPSWAKGREARLALLHVLTQVHGILDDRIQTQQQLSQVYARWLNQVKLQHSIVLHLILQSVALIAFLVLCSVLATIGANKMLDRLKIDRRRLHTLRTVILLGIQLLVLLVTALVIFGPPSQIPTILGLATAGLTVVFQDFILAFFGWFVLMGKNGIRVGDWVEISGVVGEVAEVGLFRTSLLETGNWTDKGHPTGRRVTVMNSFAITGQCFNLSTSGQWLWDEIAVNVPSGPEGYKVIEVIRQALAKETEKDAKEAGVEWQRVTHEHGLSQFSAEPSIDLRPAASGVDVVVRYVTRAGNRFELRNKIYQAVIALLHRQDEKSVPVERA
jgi:small-conductance mechanosensitive channel